MKTPCSRLSIFALAAVCLCAPCAGDVGSSAHELLERCRAAMPRDVEAKGRITLRNRRGIPQAEYSYTLRRISGETSVEAFGKDGGKIEFEKSGRILGTDVDWSDLALEYLWWNDATPDDEQESVHGQVCSVVRLKNGTREVKIWIDRKTSALMQAEELSDGKTVRRLWGTRIKKFDGKWAPNVLEVETIGSGHRTKITVEEIK